MNCLDSENYRHWVNYSAKGERSEERFSRNAETDIVCRLLLEKKNRTSRGNRAHVRARARGSGRGRSRAVCAECTGGTLAEPSTTRAVAGALPFLFFFFNDTATPEIYTLSLHDALPISPREPVFPDPIPGGTPRSFAAS